jgi:hypothetical protein
MSRASLLLCAAALGLFVLATAAAPPSAPSVRVSVVAILASETDDRIDRRLECLASEVRRMNPKLIGFRYATMTCKSAPVNREDVFDLVGDQKVKLTVEKSADADGRYQVKVTPPEMGEITYDTCCGKFLPILTRYRTDKKNELLIIAIRVQPCHGGK